MTKKTKEWTELKEEYEYQQSLLDQTNSILKRRINDMEKLLHEKESVEIEREMEIEKLRKFIGERKGMEKEFQNSFKLLGR